MIFSVTRNQFCKNLSWQQYRQIVTTNTKDVITKEFLKTELMKSRNHLTPEIVLHLLTPSCPLYNSNSESTNLHDPWWSIYWPGGQVLARTILDNPVLVKNKNVLDLGSGCGAVSIASKMSGARSVIANDIDPNAAVAAQANSDINSVTDIFLEGRDILNKGEENILEKVDVLLVGDMFYDESIGTSLLSFCKKFKEKDPSRVVLMGDPGRWFLQSNNNVVENSFDCIAKHGLEEECKKENYGFHYGLVWRMKDL